MIRTIADLLESFRSSEAELLDQQEIKHAPTIGAMYEGLTREILNKVLPDDANLKVTSGFIVSEEGTYSKQIDCMLVMGEGKPIPHTESYVYDIKNVIAVVEVKKRLYAGELNSAYRNLHSIYTMPSYDAFIWTLFRDAYTNTVLALPPYFSDLHELPLWQQHMYHTLLKEAVLPVRVVLGYHGFATEFAFRQALIDYIDEHVNRLGQGYTPAAFPNLLISNGYSIIKLNGMPYLGTIGDGNLWTFLASFSGNPMIPLLELIWTRLSYGHGLSGSVFGDDSETEAVRPLLLARAEDHGDRTGWYYEYVPIPPEALENAPTSGEWKPVTLNQIQADIIASLLIKGEIGLGDSDLQEYIEDQRCTTEELIAELRKTGLVGVEDDSLILLTKQLKMAILPDGSFVADEDSTGRFTNWVQRHYDLNLNDYDVTNQLESNLEG
jgi:hypothetical protein